MTLQPSLYEILRAIQDQQRATDRLVQILLGMLDKSAPEPFLATGPMAAPRRIREEAARPGAVLEIDGIEVHTTQRRAKLLASVMVAPQTLSAMARAGISPTVAGMKAQIRDTNADLEHAGVIRRVRMQAIAPQRRGAKGGREPALYALLGPKDEIAVPGSHPAAQGEAAAGARPDQEASASAVGEGDAVVSAQDAAFVTPTGGEVATIATQSPPAVDGQAIFEEGSSSVKIDLGGSKASQAAPTPALSGETTPELSGVGAAPAGKAERPPHPVHRQPVSAKQSARANIEPGDLIAVDVKFRQIVTPKGAYEVGGASLARALEFMRGGQLFGLDVIAKRAGWLSAEVARTALGFERNRLAEHGIDLWMDKFNARLRVSA